MTSGNTTADLHDFIERLRCGDASARAARRSSGSITACGGSPRPFCTATFVGSKSIMSSTVSSTRRGAVDEGARSNASQDSQ